jgi:hypothetical protein
MLDALEALDTAPLVAIDARRLVHDNGEVALLTQPSQSLRRSAVDEIESGDVRPAAITVAKRQSSESNSPENAQHGDQAETAATNVPALPAASGGAEIRTALVARRPCLQDSVLLSVPPHADLRAGTCPASPTREGGATLAGLLSHRKTVHELHPDELCAP